MGMLDGLIEQLENSPIVKKTIVQFEQVRDILVATVNRFDQRFGQIDEKLASVDTNTTRILFILEHPSNIVPAGDDGLMKLLEASGQEMIVRDDFKPIPVVHESEDSDESRMKAVNSWR